MNPQNQTAWAEIAEAKANPLPTPPIGATVQWCFQGDQRNIRAAIVTGIEDPGRLKLGIFSQGQMVQYKTGVYYITHANHKQSNHPTTKANGSWQYLPGQSIPKSHYEFHDTEMAKREANLVRAEEQALAQQEAFEAQQEELAAMRAAALAISQKPKKKDPVAVS